MKKINTLTLFLIWIQIFLTQKYNFSMLGVRISIVLLLHFLLLNFFKKNIKIKSIINLQKVPLFISLAIGLSISNNFLVKDNYYLLLYFVFFVLVYFFLKYVYFIEEYFKKNKYKGIFLVFLVFSILLFYLLGKNLEAKWWIIDDHEIIKFLGTDLKISIFEIPKLILNTEIGSFGHFTRYRVSYYILRILEAFLWENSPFLWYLARLIMSILSVSIFCLLLKRIVGYFIAFFFTLFILTEIYWIDIWTRLGPAETYAVFGIALYSLGFFNLIQKKVTNSFRGMNSFNWLLLLIGYLISVGSKENFIILLFPTVYLFINLIFNKRVTFLSFFVFIIANIFTVFIAASIIISLSSNNLDVYGNTVQIGSRLTLFSEKLLAFVSGIDFEDRLLAIIIVSILILLFKSKKEFKTYSKLVTKTALILIILLFIYISQMFFYNGNWPTNTRYDFPGKLAEPFSLLVIAIFSLKTAKIIGFQKNIIEYAKAGLVIGMIFLIFLKGIPLREASIGNAERTNVFTKNILLISKTLKEKPDIPVVFETNSMWDYEPLVSTKRFLSAYNVKNKIYLKINGYSKNSGSSTLEKKLSKEIYNASINGGKGIDWGYNPISNLKNEKSCFSLGFSVEPGRTICKPLSRIW